MDENLDKLVPISNQPEEKIQEIIDMSSEQYPEFESKVRKRIREYLKHCRRTQNKNNSHKIERNSNHPDSENIEEDDKEALVNRMVIMEFFSMIAIIAFFIAIIRGIGFWSRGVALNFFGGVAMRASNLEIFASRLIQQKKFFLSLKKY